MNRTIGIFIIIAAALIFSIILGIGVGTEDYLQINNYAIAAIVIYFLFRGWKNVWWFTALLVFSGAVFIHSFEFNVDHLFVLMLMIASSISLLHRSTTPIPREFLSAGSRSLSMITGLLVGYGLLHFMVNYTFPYSPNDYSWKTSTKAYFECYATMGCVFWLVTGPYGFRLRGDWAKTLIWIMVIALLANVILRAALFIMGFQAADGLSGTGSGFEKGVGLGKLYIPGVNMFPGVYTLRNIPPVISLVLFMLATEKGWWSQVGRFTKILVIGGIVLSVIYDLRKRAKKGKK